MAAREGNGFLYFVQPALFHHGVSYPHFIIFPHLAHPPPVVTLSNSIVRMVQIARG